MSNRTAIMKQVELTRLVKGVVAAGLQVDRVSVRPDGGVDIFIRDGREHDEVGPNPCDRLLRRGRA
ncbi:hypothetical protein D2T32_18185 [Sinirhodobacter populi]|nr:hypothetical protein D2T32_18185 [Sinirhodobacter populi]